MARTLPLLGRLAALLALGSGLSFVTGCAASNQACGGTASCASGKLCVTGRCRDAKSVPAAQSAQRVVLEPIALAVVSSKDAENQERADIPFGKSALGELVLLLQFPAPFTDTTNILSAYLVMDPAPGTIAGPAPVELRVARILAPWSRQDVDWARLPSLSSVESTFQASIWAGRTLRLDVTEQVRRWREHRRDDHGLAVLAAPQNEVGATYSLGLVGGNGPRLDVYLR